MQTPPFSIKTYLIRRTKQIILIWYVRIVKKVNLGAHTYINRAVHFLGNARIGTYTRILGNPKVQIGHNVYINCFCHILGDVTIGDNVLIGPQTIVWSRDHGIQKKTLVSKQTHINIPIVIEDDVWIGAHVTILKGVTIHKGAVIGAGSVVTKDIPAYSVAVGNPARVIKERS
jgi:acetyltransferase-like isoleucine patch superfamily enzyme